MFVQGKIFLSSAFLSLQYIYKQAHTLTHTNCGSIQVSVAERLVVDWDEKVGVVAKAEVAVAGSDGWLKEER